MADLNKFCSVFFSFLIFLVSTSFRLSVQAATVVAFDLLEESPAGTIVGTLANDAHILALFPASVIPNLWFNFLSHNATGKQSLFNLVEKTGQLTTREPVDRERVCSDESDSDCLIWLEVATQPIRHFRVIRVRIRLLDVNDHYPKFAKDKLLLSISEMTALGTEFTIPEATDPDSGIHGVQNYRLITDETEKNGTFELRLERGLDRTEELKLVLSKQLDREEYDQYQMKVLAWDGGSPAHSGTMLLDVVVGDVNDNSPKFLEPSYNVSIKENLPNGTIIGIVRAVDRDSGKNGIVSYTLARHTQQHFGTLFAIHQNSGEISVIGSVDLELKDKYSLGIVAYDQGLNSRSANAIVTVHLIDVNDNAPSITVNSLTRDGFPEVMENAEVGTFAAHVSVTDPDSGDGGLWDCSLSGSAFRLEQLPSTHEFKLVTSEILDREIVDEYHVTLSCSDRGLPRLASSAQIYIKILDENDESPKFPKTVYSSSIRENNNIGDFIYEIRAFDRDPGVNGQISHKISSNETFIKPPVTIDSRLGRIYSNIVFDREIKAHYELRVIAVDSGYPVRSAEVNFHLDIIDVNDEPPRFSSKLFTFGSYENQPPETEIGTVVAKDFDEVPHNQIVYSLEDASNTFRIDPSSGRISSKHFLDRESISVYLMNVSARNPGTSLVGDTQVKVIVADRNDNPPRIRYPSEANSTVQISSRARVGEVIATIEADDADVGSNAALRYIITSSNGTDGLFAVNLLNGAISVQHDLEGHADSTMMLRLVVHDEGMPQMSASVQLFVTINSSLAVTPEGVALAAVANPYTIHTVTTIVATAGASSVLIVGIIVLLLMLRQRRQPEATTSQSKIEKKSEVEKNLQAVEKSSSFSALRSEKSSEGKSKLAHKEDDSISDSTDKSTIDKKNTKNSNKTGAKDINMIENEVAWPSLYGRNLMLAYGKLDKPKNVRIHDPSFASSSLLSYQSQSLPPPPPPPASAVPNSVRYNGRGGDTSVILVNDIPFSPYFNGCQCRCQQKNWNNAGSQAIHNLSNTPTSSEGGSTTDSGMGQNEDDKHLSVSTCQEHDIESSGSQQLTAYPIYSHGVPFGWANRPVTNNAVDKYDKHLQMRLMPQKGSRFRDTIAKNLGSKIPASYDVSIISEEIKKAPQKPSRCLQHGLMKREDEEEVCVSDDATTTSGSYVIESKEVWHEKIPGLIWK